MAMQKLQRTQQPAAKASTPAKQKSFGSTGGSYRGTGNTATQSRSSGENEFANALATVTSSNAVTDGPASIRTPELDSAVGNTNATGPLAASADPSNWTGDAALYLQTGGDVDRATVRGLDNIQRRYLGDMAGGITQRQFDTAQRMSEEEGSPLLAFGRGLFSTQNDYSIPEGLTEREQRAYRTGLNTADAAQNLPAIIAEFGDNAVQSFVYPWREREANTQDPQIVQRAARAGDVTGLAAIGGLGAASAGIASTAQMVEDLVSKNNVHDPLTERTLRDFGRVQQSIAQQTADWSPKQKEYYNYAIEAFRMVPDMVLAWMTAGGSKTASLANQTTNAFARYATGLATNPVFYSTALQVTGNSYQEALEKGADEKTAALYGTLNGILNAALEVGGAQELPGEIAGAPFRNAMLDWLKSIPEEGGEEVVQGIVEKALGAIILGEDGKTISITDKDAILSLARAVDEFKGGAILSGILGGANVAINAALGGYNENPLAQTILANEQEQGSEFNTPQTTQTNEPAHGQAGTQTAPTNAQSEAQARVTEILSGTMSNSRAESIITDPELRTAFEEMSGVQLTGTKSEQRAAVKEFAAQVENTTQLNSLDNAENAPYTMNEGGDTNGLDEEAGGALRPESDRMEDRPGAPEGRSARQGDPGVPSGNGVLSPETRAIADARGIVNAGLHDSTGDNASFSAALDRSKANDPAHGCSVDSHSAGDLDESGTRTWLAGNGMAGVAVEPNGNITAVFNDPTNPVRGVSSDLILTAIENGGNKLDCFVVDGPRNLSRLYSASGFVPVAWMKFDHATWQMYHPGETWNFDTMGEPIVAFFVHNGDSAATVASNTGDYEYYSSADIQKNFPELTDYDDGLRYQEARLAEIAQQKGENGNQGNPPPTEQQPGQVRSQSEANTIQAVDEKVGAPQEVRNPIYYTPVSEEESVAQARAMLENGYEGGVPGRPNTKLTPEQSEALTAAGQRLGGGYGQAIADMQGAPAWTSVQQDMSLLMFNALAEDAKRTGDWSAYLAWRIVDQEHATEIARAMQARGKATRGETQDIMDYVADTINGSNMSQSAKDAAMAKTMQFAEEYTNTDKADTDALRDLIVRMSDERKTGTVFKKNLEKLLNGQDAEYLAKIAEAQVKGMANDYIPASVGDKVKSLQTIAQLLKITTFARNLGGNETFGFMDALVGNTFGIALDKLVGGKTGARAVGFDPRWFSSTQRKAAVDAMQKSMLEIALDVDMGTVGTKYDPRGRSFKMNGNPAERFASRLSQILSYSLTSSDAFFRGALEAGTTETLNRLNAGNEAALSQVEGVAQNRANYALFQNQGKTAQTAKAFHDRLNAWIGTGGKVENGRRTGGFGLGDLNMPYATVPANLAIKPFEYSPLGIVKGGIELAKVLKNAQSGNVNLKAQHNAVMDIARGVTGLPVALLFSQLIRSGIVKRSDDDDDYDVTKARQSENRRETQWNLDATLRWLQGGSKEWQEGDKLISLNWMEPMNAFMDIGALIADMQEDEDPTLTDYLSKYAIGSVQAAMEMPMIDGLQSAIQAMQYADSDNMWEKLGKFGESTVTSAATGMMPGAVSQLARTLDPTTRDTSADTFAARFANALMNATPGLRTLLPEKLDSLGNPITNDNPLLNALNNFILPGQVAEYAPNDVVQALDEVYEATGKSNFYPDYKPPASFSYDDADYKLDTEEKRLYQQTFGNTYEELVRNVTQSAEYDSLTAAEKAAVFSEMRSMATAEAKRAIVEGRGGEYESDYDGVANLSDIPGYFATKAMYSTASDEDNRDYRRMPEILRSYNALPDDVKEKLKTGNTSKMDELYTSWQAGASPETWFHVSDGIAEIQPLEGNKNPTAWQKYQYIVSERPQDADALFASFMDDGIYSRYQVAREANVDPKFFVDAYTFYSQNNNRKGVFIDWMVDNGYNKKQAAYMYEVLHDSHADLAGVNSRYFG